MVIGSPKGARLFILTSVPGMQPISSNFNPISGSFRQQIMPVSPIFISFTLFSTCLATAYSYLDSVQTDARYDGFTFLPKLIAFFAFTELKGEFFKLKNYC